MGFMSSRQLIKRVLGFGKIGQWVMITIDMRFDSALIQSWIGKKFNKYRITHDELVHGQHIYFDLK